MIREGDVVDFLDQKIVSQLVNSKKSKKNNVTKPFSSNKEGRLIINESDSENEIEKPQPISEDYYKQSLHSEVAFTRTPDGRIKFVKKRKRDDDEGEQGENQPGKRWNAKNKRKETNQEDVSRMLGKQYKAKKAGGDVKRPGMEDPYAYIPLKGTIVGNM